MQKGTIIYIGGFELPDKNAAALRVRTIAQLLRKIGFDVVLIGIHRANPCEATEDIHYLSKIDGCESWSILYPRSTREWIEYTTSIEGFLKVFSNYRNIKGVICYNYQAIAFDRIRRYCRKRGVPVISDCTEWYEAEGPNIIYKLLKGLDTNLRMRVVNRYVDAMITPTTYLANYYNYPKTAVIPTLVPPHNYKAPEYTENNPIRLIYAGIPFRLEKKLKNRKAAKDRLDVAMKWLYQASLRGIDFRFHIYGLTKQQYLKVLPDDTKMLNEVEDKIIFHGLHSNSYVIDEIRRCDFTLLFRDDKRVTRVGFPTKFTESIICGVPVITTRTSDLDKYVIEGQNGFFVDIDNPDGQNGLSKFFSILGLNKEHLRKMKEFCYNSKIFDMYNWEKEIERIFSD